MRGAGSNVMMRGLLVLVLLSTTQFLGVQGQQGLLLLQMKDWITFTPGWLADQAVSVSYASSQTVCFNGGGVPTSDTSIGLNNQMRFAVQQAGVPGAPSFYVGASAEPTAANPLNCVDRVSDTSATPNSGNCAYRWRFGFYDMYNYQGEPGTAFWLGLYYVPTGQQVLNQYSTSVWNVTGSSVVFPRGYYNAISGYGPSAMVRMDVPAVPVDNDPNPLATYMVVCELQMYPQLPPTTSKMPQPRFINGFKTLTWPQQHWWVIFLIAAVVILVILSVIIIYCCCTSVKPKEEPPIYSMVVRERVGKAYIVAEASPKTSTSDPNMYHGQQQDSRSPQRRDYEMQAHQQMYNAAVPPPAASAEAGQQQQRLGRGFNPREQRHDNMDDSMGNAGIYGRDNRRQHGDGNVVDDGRYGNENGYYQGMTTGGMQEDPRMAPQRPELAAFEAARSAEPDGASLAPSLTASTKRHSNRRGRGRTISQTFDDVDVPQAGEISELNVNL